MFTTLTSLITISVITGNLIAPLPRSYTLSNRGISLENRQADGFVNSVFKDNILLNMAYLRGEIVSKEQINWDNVRKPFHYVMELKPGETFAYHSDVFPEYNGRVVRTSNAHFIGEEGFKSDGYLMGDGVCHLASLIYWAAKDAGLETKAPTNHNFAVINDIPKEYGVSIYNQKGATGFANQNLYVTNNFETTVRLIFDYDGEKLSVTVEKI